MRSLRLAAENFLALAHKRGAQLARLDVELLLKLTHAGGEAIMRGLQPGRLVAVIDRARRFERGDAKSLGLVRARPVFAVLMVSPLVDSVLIGNSARSATCEPPSATLPSHRRGIGRPET